MRIRLTTMTLVKPVDSLARSFEANQGAASSGLVALYTCIQEFNGNWYVSLGSEEPDNFKVIEEGSNSLGETVYRLEAYYEDIDMRFTVFYID